MGEGTRARGGGSKGFGSGGVGGRGTAPRRGQGVPDAPRPRSGARGVSKGFGAGGVGGRGTGPRDGANFATCVQKEEKSRFLKDRGPRALVPGGRW